MKKLAYLTREVVRKLGLAGVFSGRATPTTTVAAIEFQYHNSTGAIRPRASRVWAASLIDALAAPNPA